MKWLIVLASVFFLASCQNKSNVPNNTSEDSSVSSPEPAPYQPQPAPSPPPAEPTVKSETTIATASTTLVDTSSARVQNINLACGAINGIALYPGGTFSFNETVGKRSKENGYGDAAVIVDGHSEQGCGGGVCQVSSTLYMAALNCGLEINERHPHSHSVPYAPEGIDATVVYGEKDLKFTNNSDGILTLYIWTDGKSVFSEIVKKTLDNGAV